MNKLIPVLLWLLAGNAVAQDLQLLSLREFSFDSYRLGNRRDSYLGYADPNDATDETERWLGGFATNFDIDLIKYGDWGLYHNNRVFGNGTTAQFREVAWQYEIGAQLGWQLQVYWNHESRHVLDSARDDNFPLTNMYGARYTFYRRDR